MFGLTKREQRWKAEQQAAELLVGLMQTTVRAAADVSIAASNAELERLRKENAELRAAIPTGWVAVPRIGTSVRADHPITCLNPEPTFEVAQVRAERDGNYAVRGENTCWFGIRGVRPIDGAKPSHAPSLVNGIDPEGQKQ